MKILGILSAALALGVPLYPVGPPGPPACKSGLQLAVACSSIK
jgi:hypothetical protein